MFEAECLPMRHAKEKKAEFTPVNEHFSDEHNEVGRHYGQTAIIKFNFATMTQAAIATPVNINNESEYEFIFREYYQGLCNYANMFTKDMDNAEEIVQNVFVKLWEKKDNLTLDVSIKSYLYKAVYNAALNDIKHRKVRENYLQMQTNSEATEQPLSLHNLKELEKKIENALMNLPEQCRLIFKMSRFEDLKYREIANVLNISPKTVENQMGKALRLMRENLADYLTILFIIIHFLNN